MTTRVAIGCGSGYAEDRLEPAAALAASGAVDYLAYDCLAERTLALAQMRRSADPATGQDRRIAAIVAVSSPMLANGGRIIGNFGAANPDAGLRDVVDSLRAEHLEGVRVGVIRGDDVLEQALERDLALPELGTTIGELKPKVVSAHAYIGAEAIVEALGGGAAFVLGGRLADPSLFVGPIVHELGWALDDWERLGIATAAGHMLECGIHGSGANFEDPPLRTVADPAEIGQPMAFVSDDELVVTKLPGTGGAIDLRTAKTQLLYEIHDPARYLTPDVTADFSAATVEEVGPDAVRISGVTGSERPSTLKVLVGVDFGFKAVGEISYGGTGCVDRARRAEEIVRARLEPEAAGIDEIRFDLHGATALFGRLRTPIEPQEVRLRVAARCATRELAERVVKEVELLYFGPAGAGGASGSVTRAIGVTPAFIPRDDVHVEVEVVAA